MNRDLWRALLGGREPDPGCEATFEELDRYVEAVLAGGDVAQQFPGIVAHLASCDACREDAEGLLAALAADDPSRFSTEPR